MANRSRGHFGVRSLTKGDVYPATFAAVPHVIAALARDPIRADSTFFQFPAWVEICRHKQGIEIPPDLEAAYLESLSLLPNLVAAASARAWDADFLQCALSAIAAAKGYSKIAEATLELSPDVADDFMEWFVER